MSRAGSSKKQHEHIQASLAHLEPSLLKLLIRRYHPDHDQHFPNESSINAMSSGNAKKVQSVLGDIGVCAFPCHLLLLWSRIEYCALLIESHCELDVINNEMYAHIEPLIASYSDIAKQFSNPEMHLELVYHWRESIGKLRQFNSQLINTIHSLRVSHILDSVIFNEKHDQMAVVVDRNMASWSLLHFKLFNPLKIDPIDSCFQVLQNPFKDSSNILIRSHCDSSHLKNCFGRKLNSYFRHQRLRSLKIEHLAKTGADRVKPMAIIDTELGIEEDGLDREKEEDIPSNSLLLADDEIDGVLLDDTYVQQNMSEDSGFGTAYRDIWNGAIVSVKRVLAKDFICGKFGLLQAAQVLQLNYLSSTQRQEQQAQRTQHQSQQQCPFLHSVFVSCVHNDIGYFVSPLAPLGSMQELFLTEPRDAHPLEASQKVSFLLDVISGIAFLHANGIIHGRLKAANILVFNNYRAKLCDFGVQSYISSASKLENKGIDGVRWMAPEVVREEQELQESQAQWAEAIAAQNKEFEERITMGTSAHHNKQVQHNHGHVGNVVHCLPNLMGPFGPRFLLDSSVDIYAFGLVIVVLETRKKPFHNIELNEGVICALLRGDHYPMPGVYRHKAFFRPDIDHCVVQCQQHAPALRPTAATLVTTFETVLLRVITMELERSRLVKQRKLDGVLTEIADLQRKLKDVSVFVSKGVELIAKREKELAKVFHPIEKKKEESAIALAKEKLIAFRADQAAIEEDLEGAQSDRDVLQKLVNDINTRIAGGRDTLFGPLRGWNEALDQQNDLLYEKYFSLEEKEFITQQQQQQRQHQQSIHANQLSKFIAKHLSESPNHAVHAIKVDVDLEETGISEQEGIDRDLLTEDDDEEADSDNDCDRHTKTGTGKAATDVPSRSRRSQSSTKSLTADWSYILNNKEQLDDLPRLVYSKKQLQQVIDSAVLLDSNDDNANAASEAEGQEIDYDVKEQSYSYRNVNTVPFTTANTEEVEEVDSDDDDGSNGNEDSDDDTSKATSSRLLSNSNKEDKAATSAKSTSDSVTLASSYGTDEASMPRASMYLRASVTGPSSPRTSVTSTSMSIGKASKGNDDLDSDDDHLARSMTKSTSTSVPIPVSGTSTSQSANNKTNLASSSSPASIKRKSFLSMAMSSITTSASSSRSNSIKDSASMPSVAAAVSQQQQQQQPQQQLTSNSRNTNSSNRSKPPPRFREILRQNNSDVDSDEDPTFVIPILRNT